MKKRAILTAVLLLVAFSFASLAPQNGYDLFQKALAKERAEGNLEEAIALYKRVVKEVSDESLAAKAQLRIGICYEKLGKQEAQKAYQKVIDNYPKQVETVKAAREKLSGLLRTQILIKEGDSGLRIRHLATAKPDDEFAPGEVSPDGRYITYFDYDVWAMAVHEIATGKKRILKSKIKENEPEGESWSFTWSPDGKAIICSWWQGPNRVWDEDQVSDWHWADLRILRVDRSAQRRLFHSEGYDDVYPMDWSSDGRQVLTAFYGGHLEGNKMGLISVEDGSVRVLKTIDYLWGNMEFSPDDRYIVYDFLPGKEYSRRDISILSVDGKVDIPLVLHPAHDSLLGWSPDGKYILFLSDRTGTNDLWIIPVKNGKPVGKPELIKKGLGKIYVAGMTQDGSLYYSYQEQMEDIYIAKLDQSTGKIKKGPEKMVLSQEGSNSWPQYSPDGKSIVCVQGGGIMAGQVETSLCVRSLETGTERLFPLRTKALFPRWSPDGLFIYFTAYVRINTDIMDLVVGNPYRTEIHRLELKTGQISKAWRVWPEEPEEKHFGYLFAGISPDGKSYYFVKTDEKNKLCQLIVRDSETGTEKELFRMNGSLPFRLSLSPNGRWFAVVGRKKERTLRILSTTGGQSRELHRFETKGGHPTMLDWTPDSKFIIFSKRIDSSKSGVSGWGLYRISVDGGDPQNLGINMTYISEITVHPSGKQLAFCSYGPEWKKSELWVMENFLPKEKNQKKNK